MNLPWPTAPLKRVAGINERSLPGNTDPNFEFRYVDISSVGRGVLIEEPKRIRLGDAPSRARRVVRAGDTLVSTVRTYLRAVWPARGDVEDVVASTGFAVLTPRQLNARFFSRWVSGDPFIEEVVARSVGVSYPAINATELGDLPVPLPSREEQVRIADFLDRETVHIDELVRKKQRLAQLVREQLDSRISLLSAHEDPDWVPLSRYLDSVTQGYSPVCESHPADEGKWGVLKLSAVDRGTFRPQENKALPGAEEARREYEVREGDVLVTRSNTPDLVGDVCVVRKAPEKLLLPDLIYRLDLRRDAFDPRFLTYFLLGRRIRGLISAVARGSSRSMVKLRGEDIGSIRVPCPPVDEQRRIADELDHHAEMADRAIEALSAQVDRLMERRQALITAAVTGQIDIGKAA